MKSQNHSQIPNGTIGRREKDVKADDCQLDSDNGIPSDTLRGLQNSESKFGVKE